MEAVAAPVVALSDVAIVEVEVSIVMVSKVVGGIDEGASHK
jgi:hypothetical protein